MTAANDDGGFLESCSDLGNHRYRGQVAPDSRSPEGLPVRLVRIVSFDQTRVGTIVRGDRVEVRRSAEGPHTYAYNDDGDEDEAFSWFSWDLAIAMPDGPQAAALLVTAWLRRTPTGSPVAGALVLVEIPGRPEPRRYLFEWDRPVLDVTAPDRCQELWNTDTTDGGTGSLPAAATTRT